MSTMSKVREQLERSHKAHRQLAENRLREAAVARAQQEADQEVTAPQTGLQPPPGVVLDVGGD